MDRVLSDCDPAGGLSEATFPGVRPLDRRGKSRAKDLVVVSS
jgi:hypothetical protein